MILMILTILKSKKKDQKILINNIIMDSVKMKNEVNKFDTKMRTKWNAMKWNDSSEWV